VETVRTEFTGEYRLGFWTAPVPNALLPSRQGRNLVSPRSRRGVAWRVRASKDAFTSVGGERHCVLDDAYNATRTRCWRHCKPCTISVRGRRCVLGDMVGTRISHGECSPGGGRRSAELGVNRLWGWQMGSRNGPRRPVPPGWPTRRNSRTSRPRCRIKKLVRPGDVVLLKASRVIGLGTDWRRDSFLLRGNVLARRLTETNDFYLTQYLLKLCRETLRARTLSLFYDCFRYTPSGALAL